MALFLWEHRFFPGGGFGGMPISDRSARSVLHRRVKVSWQPHEGGGFGRCEGAGAGTGTRSSVEHQELGSPWVWVTEVHTGPSHRGESFCLGFLPIWEWNSAMGSFPLYLCAKGDPQGLTLAYAKMRRARWFSFSIFFLIEEGAVIASWTLCVEGSSNISNAISWQMQKLGNILKPSWCVHWSVYHQACL